MLETLSKLLSLSSMLNTVDQDHWCGLFEADSPKLERWACHDDSSHDLQRFRGLPMTLLADHGYLLLSVVIPG